MSVTAIIASISLLILGLSPTRAANEAAAIATLRTLVTSEKLFWITAGGGKYGDLGQLRGEKLIDEVLATGHRQGYDFALTTDSKSFTITAAPASSRNGTRSFYTDASGVIRARVGLGAGPGDPPIGNP